MAARDVTLRCPGFAVMPSIARVLSLEYMPGLKLARVAPGRFTGVGTATVAGIPRTTSTMALRTIRLLRTLSVSSGRFVFYVFTISLAETARKRELQNNAAQEVAVSSHRVQEQ
jgi:hypothetical protein